ncbi:MAG TPA: hypothetical protein VE870_01705 [Bacteroidales bacterium]|nr:hypothetical protein [Bacteroidales bacterium]
MRIKKHSILNVFLFSILTTGFFLYSCEKYTYEPPSVNPDKVYSFKDDILPIFNNCAACHPSIHEPDLSQANAYTSLTEGGYVNTDAPEKSKIIEKLDEGHAGINNNSPEYIDILGWITQGAKNN